MWGQMVQFTARSFSAFPGTPMVDLKIYFIMFEKTPYRDIHHTLCGEHSDARWANSEEDTHMTLSFSYLTK
ncbi:hypothetical protein HAX54_032782, partial [Datura stramonium]|nr:hypothetical protein [Datura stramonium]